MKGGSYTRNEDGSLTLIERTLEPGEAADIPAVTVRQAAPKTDRSKPDNKKG